MLRAFILATIVALFAAPAGARDADYTEEVCGTWARFTMSTIVLWNSTGTAEEYQLAIKEVLSEVEEDAATVKTIQAIAEFVEANAEAGVSARTLVETVYEACTEKLSKQNDV